MVYKREWRREGLIDVYVLLKPCVCIRYCVVDLFNCDLI